METKDRQQQYLEFALGTLEGEEYEEIRRLLDRQDPECVRGVEEARAVVAQLAYAAPEAAAPERVRKKLLEAVAEPSQGRRWTPVLSWAVAAGLLIFAVITERRVHDLRGQLVEAQQRYEQLSREHQRLQAEASTYRQVLAIVSAPNTRSVSLKAQQAPQLHAYWNDPLGLVLAGQNVPIPAPDRTLQLWIIPAQGNPINAGIFRPDDDGRTLHVIVPSVAMSQASALAITDEPAGGRPQPTSTPIWVGPIG